MSRDQQQILTSAGVIVLRWPAIEAAGADVIITTRHGGVSKGSFASLNLGLHVGDRPAAVIENRRRAARAMGAELEDLVVANQVHGSGAAHVSSGDRGRGATDLDEVIGDADILITSEPGPVLMTMVADCAPIVLVHPGAQVLATVHAGWRGTVENAVGRALETMVAMSAPASGVRAVVGPSISATRYQVGPEVADTIRARFGPEASEVLAIDDNGDDRGDCGGGGDDGRRWRLDLQHANRLLLEAAGVPRDQIVVSTNSTDDFDMFFSDRTQRPCGRFGLLARLRS